MAKTRRERCPHCGFLEVIKWGRRANHQRYKCKNCGSLFTFRRKDVSKANRFVWFEWWILRKTLKTILHGNPPIKYPLHIQKERL